MYCYKMTIAYDGTSYSGWQVQPNASSIQQLIEDVLKIVLRNEVRVIGSGRTDAGVHAYGQVAHFKHTELLDVGRLLFSLNGMLPPAIRIKSMELVPLHFHAQYSAIGKEYHYHLYLDRVMDPFRRLYCWHIHRRVEVDLFIKAAPYFLGTHNFTSFANEAYAGSASRDPVRTLHRLDVKPEEGGLRLEFEGDGFLYKMVRNIVGTLVDVASHRLTLEDIPLIFQAKDRRKASKAAPAHGLFLMRVMYDLPDKEHFDR